VPSIRRTQLFRQDRGAGKELPPLLVALGQKEQQQGAQEEPKSTENAVAHLEKAATSFEMAQELDKNNQPAQQGEEQVEKDLARLRALLAQRAEARTSSKRKTNLNNKISSRTSCNRASKAFNPSLPK